MLLDPELVGGWGDESTYTCNLISSFDWRVLDLAELTPLRLDVVHKPPRDRGKSVVPRGPSLNFRPLNFRFGS